MVAICPGWRGQLIAIEAWLKSSCHSVYDQDTAGRVMFRAQSARPDLACSHSSVRRLMVSVFNILRAKD